MHPDTHTHTFMSDREREWQHILLSRQWSDVASLLPEKEKDKMGVEEVIGNERG